MVAKRVLCPQRLRRIPRQFSWVDHCLVRDKHICGLSPESLALYLFLVTVSDADGLSFYSDGAIQRYLNLDVRMVDRARTDLCDAGLIAYTSPLYQVLSLQKPSDRLASAPCEHPQPRIGGEALSIGQILREAMGGVQ